MSEENTNLYTAKQVQAMDHMAIHERGIPGIELMERAGLAAFELLRKHWPDARSIAVFCGTGNNGGDGYVIARLAFEAGMQVCLYQVGDHTKLKGDALSSANQLNGSDVKRLSWKSDSKIEADVIVDAMLGTGLSGEVSDHYREVIEAINVCHIPVLAIDIPSGLHSDNGTVLGLAVRAERTISFIGMKKGLYTGMAPDYVGELHFSGLAIPHDIYASFDASAMAISYDSQKSLLGPRSRISHKGQNGHVLIIGGNHGFSGAARLAGEAALRAGAGLVTIATRKEHASCLNTGRPELMVHGVEQASDLAELMDRADVLVIGPGLGQDNWARQLFARVLESQLPMVIDADGLNLLAQNPLQKKNWVLTPHPAEAGRLLGQSTKEINADRYAAIEQLQKSYGGTVVLKGAGSLIRSAEPPTTVCTEGNPGMATAGMGDVLSGIIASLMGQGLAQDDAAMLGVCLHASAADGAVSVEGERGLLASDLMPWIRKRVNP